MWKIGHWEGKEKRCLRQLVIRLQLRMLAEPKHMTPPKPPSKVERGYSSCNRLVPAHDIGERW